MYDRVKLLVEFAREIALGLQMVNGPSAGDHATAAFLKRLRQRVFEALHVACWEKKTCGPTSYAVDFCLEAEQTVVEVALGLPTLVVRRNADGPVGQH